MRRQKRAIAAQKEVSIHASVKDATVSGLSITPSDIVSIHASVKDATTGCLFAVKSSNGFNPRICKRCDTFIDPMGYRR